jgi:hypothetical protein
MWISLTTAQINFLIAIMSAVSAVSAFILVSWPYLMPDTLGYSRTRAQQTAR